MFSLIATHIIQPKHRDAYLKAIKEDAIGSLKNEPGCSQFDILQDEKDPNTFYLHETYTDRAAFEFHLTTPHFKKWDDTVKNWFQKEPTVLWCNTIFPSDAVQKAVKTIVSQ
ncbi:MAG: hypothetical protein A3E84_04190 [Gammaproteobacteria bacterium RIFCSPHIGHO2_12_FULL_42_13]|nr:MAG: hypothetical protein A3E84_04190 [Gammaproteobacteria bacterium RIFCSPHIGHO2_12_FULL_42_13]